jgi:hypothetical protein
MLVLSIPWSLFVGRAQRGWETSRGTQQASTWSRFKAELLSPATGLFPLESAVLLVLYKNDDF